MSETLSVGITGAGGYIGSRVAVELIEDGNNVLPVDNFYDAKTEEIVGNEIIEADIRSRPQLRKVFEGVDAIMHLAAISGVEDCEQHPELAYDTNVIGTENVAWLCREWGIPLVFPASMAMIGDPVEFPITSDHPRNPLNLYGRTKWMSELDIHALASDSFPSLVLMKSNLYGYHELEGRSIGKPTVINIFVESALAENPLRVHEPGTQTRDFIHLNDVARVYRLALEYLRSAPNGSRTLPIASGECRSVLEIAEIVQSVTEETHDVRVPIEFVENPREAETEVKDFTVDTSLAREVIGFEAEHTVEDTIRSMVSP